MYPKPKPASELSQAAEKQPEAAPTMPSEKEPKAETEPTKYSKFWVIICE